MTDSCQSNLHSKSVETGKINSYVVHQFQQIRPLIDQSKFDIKVLHLWDKPSDCFCMECNEEVCVGKMYIRRHKRVQKVIVTESGDHIPQYEDVPALLGGNYSPYFEFSRPVCAKCFDLEDARIRI